MARSMRTLVFAIHNPSRRTAATLHRALRAYTNATAAVLNEAAREWDALCADAERGGALNLLQLQKALTQRYRSRTVTFPLHSSLRDAIFVDLAAQLGGYHALMKRWEAERAKVRARIAAEGWDLDPLDARAEAALQGLGAPPAWPTVPRVRPDYAAYDDALESLVAIPDVASDTALVRLTPVQRLVNRLDIPTSPRLSRTGARGGRLASLVTVGTRPLLFPRSDGAEQARNFSLLRSEKDNRYYALLYVLPNKDARARPLAATTPDSRHGQLVAVHPSAVTIARSTKPSLALCLPLACGSWHEKTALQEAITHPKMVRIARLYHRPARAGHRADRFMLAITFEHELPETRATSAHMAVTMDERSRIAWYVVDALTGRELARGVDESLVGLQERWRRDQRMRMQMGRLGNQAHHTQSEHVKHAAHTLCNRLIAIADEHDAQVVLNDVSYLHQRRLVHARDQSGKREARSPLWHELMAERQYRRATLIDGKIAGILRDKLPRVGLPKPLAVHGISPRDCTACGGRGTEEAFCGVCGAPLGIENTARVVAARTPVMLERVRAGRAKRSTQDGGNDLDTTMVLS